MRLQSGDRIVRGKRNRAVRPVDVAEIQRLQIAAVQTHDIHIARHEAYLIAYHAPGGIRQSFLVFGGNVRNIARLRLYRIRGVFCRIQKQIPVHRIHLVGIQIRIVAADTAHADDQHGVGAFVRRHLL